MSPTVDSHAVANKELLSIQEEIFVLSVQLPKSGRLVLIGG
jgi:hypothetical protein